MEQGVGSRACALCGGCTARRFAQKASSATPPPRVVVCARCAPAPGRPRSAARTLAWFECAAAGRKGGSRRARHGGCALHGNAALPSPSSAAQRAQQQQASARRHPERKPRHTSPTLPPDPSPSTPACTTLVPILPSDCSATLNLRICAPASVKCRVPPLFASMFAAAPRPAARLPVLLCSNCREDRHGIVVGWVE